MQKILFAISSFAVLFATARADQHPISIDGSFDDWASVTVAYEDEIGDGFPADFVRVWLADDAEFLFVRIEFTGLVDASENNSIRLLLDTDNDSGTGLQMAGIGAELEWVLGERFGVLRAQGESVVVAQNDISFRGGPTVTSNSFEFAIGRDSMPGGVYPLFTGPSIRVAIVDVSGNDQLPNAGEVLDYEFDLGQTPTISVIPLERVVPSDLRMLSHNVLGDGPWNPSLQQSFGRLWSVPQPDILNLQEVFSHSLGETIELVDQLVPPKVGEAWYGAKQFDCVTISRFPVLDSWAIDGNLAVLLQTSGEYGKDCLIINAHLPCCNNNVARRVEIDRLMEFVRDARESGGRITLDQGTPIVICGDLNLVGFAQDLVTLLTGDIGDNGTYGPDFEPDWDLTDLENVISRQTERRMGYTWRNDASSFWPGQLDYFIYTDSVLDLRKDYLIYTPEMAEPMGLGLAHEDSLVSDHLVFVADFHIPNDILHGDVNRDGQINLLDVAPFIDVLSSGGYQAEADVNKDAVVNLVDVAPFIDLLGN